MKTSQFFIQTLKEAPAEAEIVSHQLMIRAGVIKKVASGIFTVMPMAPSSRQGKADFFTAWDS